MEEPSLLTKNTSIQANYWLFMMKEFCYTLLYSNLVTLVKCTKLLKVVKDSTLNNVVH